MYQVGEQAQRPLTSESDVGNDGTEVAQSLSLSRVLCNCVSRWTVQVELSASRQLLPVRASCGDCSRVYSWPFSTRRSAQVSQATCWAVELPAVLVQYSQAGVGVWAMLGRSGAEKPARGPPISGHKCKFQWRSEGSSQAPGTRLQGEEEQLLLCWMAITGKAGWLGLHSLVGSSGIHLTPMLLTWWVSLLWPVTGSKLEQSAKSQAVSLQTEKLPQATKLCPGQTMAPRPNSSLSGRAKGWHPTPTPTAGAQITLASQFWPWRLFLLWEKECKSDLQTGDCLLCWLAGSPTSHNVLGSEMASFIHGALPITFSQSPNCSPSQIQSLVGSRSSPVAWIICLSSSHVKFCLLFIPFQFPFFVCLKFSSICYF